MGQKECSILKLSIVPDSIFGFRRDFMISIEIEITKFCEFFTEIRVKYEFVLNCVFR